MLIANPIYDTVFKYLMDDHRVARVVISTIIGEEIEELAFKQRERSAQLATLPVRIFRLDFSAVVKTADGSRRNILIEIQKAESGDDIPRFRRYLAENYYSPIQKDSIGEEEANTAQEPEAPIIPIITIYILGYSLELLKGHSAVKVKRFYFDAVTGDKINDRVDFIEHLTHDSYVIQVSELKRRRRNKLEQLLAFFEQMNLQANRHLKIFDEEVPEDLHSVLERLYQAAQDKTIREQMEVEDEFLNFMRRKERAQEQALEEVRIQLEETQMREEEERRLREEAQMREEEERRLKDDALAELAELRRQLGLTDK